MLVGRLTKDTGDVSRVTIDFSKWLDAGEQVGSATIASIAVEQQASWSTDAYILQPPLPVVDTTPLNLVSESIVNVTPPGATAPVINGGVQLMLGSGTPGVTYIVTFLATGASSGRTKDIDIEVTVRPLLTSGGVGSTLPPPVPLVIQVTSFQITSVNSLWLVDPTTAPITATLPSSPNAGDVYSVKDCTGKAATHNITVSGGTHNIENGTSIVITQNYGWVNLLFNGTVWVQIGSPPNQSAPLSATESATFTIGGTATIYLCDTTANVLTATMPAAPAVGVGYTIKDVGGHAATNPITIAGNGHNIEGAATMLIDTAYGWVNLVYTGPTDGWVQVG